MSLFPLAMPPNQRKKRNIYLKKVAVTKNEKEPEAEGTEKEGPLLANTSGQKVLDGLFLSSGVSCCSGSFVEEREYFGISLSRVYGRLVILVQNKSGK
ncbi:hypothetical protein CEXT_1191 [Caerostris extrusa]|uniref:Uncharacterized protein n=1 Tax=Caerostris extrusa TaxID=172846 RepID=A0AAV4UTF1_CAEEX|nr:hypothetical protein CEXT_1191 [Caerostris extrusa]